MPYKEVEFMPPAPPAPPVDPRSRFPVARAGATAPSAERRPGNGTSAQAQFDWDGAAQLNPRYTFEAFVIGGGNQFAHAAALAVAERHAYNPLFIYGGVGMGKTHLMQAIGHETKKLFPHMALRYITSEAFTNEMIGSLRYEKMSSFRDKFRSLDMLLIDDAQFFARKEAIQEEFFHTFNALHEAQKQIVIASDRPPRELAEIEDRLRSRFEWGLIADIQPPDLETKVAILQKKAENEKTVLPTEVALFVASHIRSNVRELEGALIRLVAKASLDGVSPLTVTYAQEALKNIIEAQVRKVTVEAVQKVVAEQLGLRVIELKSKNNSRAIVVPRQIAMYLTKQLTDCSLPEIGRQFGGKHHTTVLHSVAKIENQRKADKDLNRMLVKLTEMLSS
jgi:chromosomal replication initiator protein